MMKHQPEGERTVGSAVDGWDEWMFLLARRPGLFL